jgi:uncharacterized membrane protein YeaQ/YmgE (transglycosylase-associated protein family)
LAQGVGMGVIGDIIVGIVGVLLGGFVLSLLAPGVFALISFNGTSLVIALIAAVILFLALNVFTGRRPVSLALWMEAHLTERFCR